MGGIVLTLAVEPPTISKRLVRVVTAGNGHSFPAWPKVGKRVLDQLRADAFTLGVDTMRGPLLVGVVSYWREPWGAGDDHRAPGMAKGDVDAVLSVVLDALAKAGVYSDDAWVAVVVGAKAVDARDPRVEAFVGPLSSDVLAWMSDRLDLAVPPERVLLGGLQERLTL